MHKFIPTGLFGCVLLTASAASAQGTIPTVDPRDGWAVHDSDKPYQELVDDVKAAAGSRQLGVVTEAGPTGAAADRGIDIPGNRVLGLFNNDYAVRILRASTAAMIEAPIRMYVTEAPDGTATLSYKLPTYIYGPYMEEGGEDLATAAEALETDFAAVAATALEK